MLADAGADDGGASAIRRSPPCRARRAGAARCWPCSRRKGYARVEPVDPAAGRRVSRSLGRGNPPPHLRVRRRPTGNELCLRPDLTIPVCRMYLAGGASRPARLCYHGPAFRVQPNEPERPAQFLQTGVENLGAADRDAADIEVLTLTVEAVRAAGLTRFHDQGRRPRLFSALVDALDIPPQWRGRLKRHFWRPGLFPRTARTAVATGARARANLSRASRAVAEPAEARAALSRP